MLFLLLCACKIQWYGKYSMQKQKSVVGALFFTFTIFVLNFMMLVKGNENTNMLIITIFLFFSYFCSMKIGKWFLLFFFIHKMKSCFLFFKAYTIQTYISYAFELYHFPIKYKLQTQHNNNVCNFNGNEIISVCHFKIIVRTL